MLVSSIWHVLRPDTPEFWGRVVSTTVVSLAAVAGDAFLPSIIKHPLRLLAHYGFIDNVASLLRLGWPGRPNIARILELVIFIMTYLAGCTWAGPNHLFSVNLCCLSFSRLVCSVAGARIHYDGPEDPVKEEGAECGTELARLSTAAPTALLTTVLAIGGQPLRHHLFRNALEVPDLWCPAFILVVLTCLGVFSAVRNRDDLHFTGPLDFIYFLRGVAGFYDDKLTLLQAWVARWVKHLALSSSEAVHSRRIGYQNIDPFKYAPLDAGEIRLLHLRKRSIFSGLINLELVPVVLSQAAAYNFEAISYTWGSEPPSKAILLNGSSHAVTPNVHALLHARGSMFRDRFLWIDSMCINQADMSEKTTQLRMMASIYETAHRVISWLGDHPAAALAAEFLQNNNDYFSATSQHLESSTSQINYISWKAQYWLSFFDVVCRNPYFSRVWICQECVLGRAIHFYIAGTYISYSKIQQQVMTSVNTTWQSALAIYTADSTIPSIMMESLPLMSLREQHSPPTPKFKLGALLSLSSRCKCHNPLDKIYGMLGMCPPETTDSLNPDYSTPSSVVYTRAAGILIAQGEADFILPHAGISVPGRAPSLPSWAPDWANESTQSRLPLRAYDRQDMLATAPLASPATPAPPFAYHSVTHRLTARMTRKDTIAHLAAPIDFNITTTIPHWRHRHALDAGLAERTKATKAVLDLWRAHHTGTDEAVWRTLVANLTTRREVPDPGYASVFRAWIGTLGRTSDEKEEEKEEGEISLQLGDDEVVEVLRVLGLAGGKEAARGLGEDGEARRRLAMQVAAMEMNVRLAEVSVGRRACVTKRGRIGWVPEGAERGDVVVELGGVVSEYVVRDVGGGKIRLVGEGYVHGVGEELGEEEEVEIL